MTGAATDWRRHATNGGTGPSVDVECVRGRQTGAQAVHKIHATPRPVGSFHFSTLGGSRRQIGRAHV